MSRRGRGSARFYLIFAVAMIGSTLVVSYSQSLDRTMEPLEPLLRYTYLFPIALMAFTHGWVSGLLSAGISLLLMYSVAISLPTQGAMTQIITHASTIVLFITFPLLVDSVGRMQRRHTELSNTISRLNRILSERLSSDKLLPAILSEAISRCPARYAAIYWRDQRSGSFDLAASFGFQDLPGAGEALAAMASAGMKRWAGIVADTFVAREAKGLYSGFLARDSKDLPSGLSLSLDWPLGADSAPRSYVAVPLQGAGGHFGAVVLFATNGSRLEAADVENLASVVQTSQTAIEQAWLHAEVERTAWELGILNDLARAASASLDLDETIRGVVMSLRRAFHDYCVELFYWDREQGRLALRARASNLANECSRKPDGPVPPYAELVLGARQPVPSGELEARGLTPPFEVGSEQYEHFYGVPLTVGRDVVGALCFHSHDATAFDARRRELLKAAASQVAVAVSSASLYGKTDRELARNLTELSTLQSLSKEFNATLDLDQVLNLVLGQCIQLTSADAGVIALWDRTRPDSEPAYARSIVHGVTGEDLPPAAREAMDRVLDGEALLETVSAQAGRTSDAPVRLRLCVPIRRASRTVGAIYLEASRPSSFLQTQARFIAHLAEHAAIALENARLYDEMTTRAGELQLLLNVGAIVSSTLNVDVVLPSLAAKIVSSLQVAFCHISLLDEGGQRLLVKARATVSERADVIADMAQELPLDLTPTFREVIRSGRTFLVRQEDPETCLTATELRLAADPMTQSALLMPLVAGEHVLGVIALGEHRRWDRSPITDEKIDLCRAMASQAAIALENAQLFKVVAEDRRRTQHILADIADGVLTTDGERRIATFNPAAERITGWPREEVIGRFVCGLMCSVTDGPTAECMDECPLQRSLSHGEITHFGPMVWRASRRASGELQVAGSIAPLRGSGGEVVGTVGIFRDVTREAELDQLKSDFVSMVSHEIRSPLASISAAAEMLHRGLGGRPASELLEVIRTQSLHLGGFVEDVLNVSRLERGVLEVNVEPIPIVPVLRRCIAVAQASTNRHTLRLETALEGTFVLADGSKIEVVIGNLLRNAINYSPQGGRVIVSVAQQGDEVVVGVMDEGIGIPADYHDRIFDRFTRVDDGDAKTIYGHGLGLYIARGIVERHGGRIWFESEPGKGSRFFFSLPAFAMAAEAREGMFVE